MTEAEAKITELRQRMPAAARRNQLLDVALERFAARGYFDTSMEEIADAAGVTKPVLYQHFQSKQHLFLELLDSVGRDLLADVERRAGAEENPYQRVLAGFRAYFRFVCDRPAAFQLVFGSGARLSDEFAESVRRLEEGIAATIARFIEAEIDAGHRELLGYAIVGLGEVAGRRWVALHGGSDGQVPADLDQAEADLMATRLADLVWAGLRGLPGSAAQRAGQA
ncbi:MAG TPA: TetR/AcrR family transcriptional regulator [Acidimicrobiales bacterium]|nr:TetR/AcrR family transcriptional regulator [Acidimicrobiales bacterium]